MSPTQAMVSFFPVFHVVIDNFLGPILNRRIFEHLISLKKHFVPAEVTLGNREVAFPKIRSNTTVYIDTMYHGANFVLDSRSKNWTKVRKYRAEKSPLLSVVDTAIEKGPLRAMMDSAPFPLCKFRVMNTWETQVSRYGDAGQFFTWHDDRKGDDRRTVSMVYYIFKEPKQFVGGKLQLTDGLLYGGKLVGPCKIREIAPKNDRLVIFGSRTVHSVKPTVSPLRFEDGRFSVSTWLGKSTRFSADDQW